MGYDIRTRMALMHRHEFVKAIDEFETRLVTSDPPEAKCIDEDHTPNPMKRYTHVINDSHPTRIWSMH